MQPAAPQMSLHPQDQAGQWLSQLQAQLHLFSVSADEDLEDDVYGGGAPGLGLLHQSQSQLKEAYMSSNSRANSGSVLPAVYRRYLACGGGCAFDLLYVHVHVACLSVSS